MKQTPSHLPDHIGYWLRSLSNHVSQSFADRLEKHSVSVPQWTVLRVLYDHDSLPLKDLVSRIGVDQGAMSRMIDRLLVRGLVTRKGNPASRREIAISLSPQGRQLVPRLAREADENDRAFFGQLPERERETFLASIKTLLSLNQTGHRGIPLA